MIRCSISFIVVLCFLVHPLFGSLGSWTFLPSTENTPSARYYTKLVDYNESILSFMGVNATNDVSSYGITTGRWTSLASSPINLYGHSAVKKDDTVIIFGGLMTSTSIRSNAVLVYNISSNSWKEIPTTLAPPARTLHTAVVYENDMIVYGGGRGFGTPTYNDIWRWNIPLQQWSQDSPNGTTPAHRSGHSAVVTADGKMVVFGGFDTIDTAGPTTYYNDVFTYDLLSKIWIQVGATGTPPIPTSEHGAVITAKNIMIIFGGRREGGVTSKMVYRFNITTTTWISDDTVPGPAVSGFGVTLLKGRMYVFGGYSEFYTSNELHYYSDETLIDTVGSNDLPSSTEMTESANVDGDSRTSTKQSELNKVPIIAVSVVVGVLIITSLIVLLFIVKKRRAPKKNKNSNNDVELHSSVSPSTGTAYGELNGI